MTAIKRINECNFAESKQRMKEFMAQEETYQLLKRKRKWMTTKEVAEELKISIGSTTKNLNKLHQHGEIFKKLKRTNFDGGALWKVK